MASPQQFIVPTATACYLAPAIRASIPARVQSARDELKACRACPRGCAIARSEGETGTCGIGRYARVASAGPHFGEEDCLRGTNGSGTIFFAGCNLHCVFCQNWDISQQRVGQEMNARQIADIMLELQEAGCHNINLVTPEHVVPQVVESLATAIDDGLRLPVVYNTSAYDSTASLRLLDGLVDIYMPDFKLWTSATASRLCHAPEYPSAAREAVREMHRQVGDLLFTPHGVACRGLLIRHLVMPGLPDESREILRWLAQEISPDTFVNVMGQYRPENEVGTASTTADGTRTIRYADINRRPSRAEITAAYQAARDAGLWRFDTR